MAKLKLWKGRAFWRDDLVEDNFLAALVRTVDLGKAGKTIVCWDFSRDRIFQGPITKSKDGILIKEESYDLYLMPADDEYVFEHFKTFFGYEVESIEQMYKELNANAPKPFADEEYE